MNPPGTARRLFLGKLSLVSTSGSVFSQSCRSMEPPNEGGGKVWCTIPYHTYSTIVFQQQPLVLLLYSTTIMTMILRSIVAQSASCRKAMALHVQSTSRNTCGQHNALVVRRWQHPPPSSKPSDKATAAATATNIAPSETSLVIDSAKSFGIGTLAGLLGSLAGMGGGFVMIPLMTSMLRLTQHQAHGTSLFAVAATGMAGAASYGPAVACEPAAAVALTGMVTARIGARTTTTLSEKSLKQLLGILMLCMSVAVPAKAHFMQQVKEKERAAASLEKTNDDASEKNSSSALPNEETTISSLVTRLAPAAAIGTCSGFMAGLFGVGGGVIVVPALTLFTSCNHYQALATSLAAMTLPAMAGTWTHHCAGNVALRVAPALATGALVGAAVGGQVGTRTNESTLRWGFASLLAVLGTRTLLKA